MKKIFFSLLAGAAIASCAKTEDVYTPDQAEIKLAPVAAMTTKANVTAAIEGTTYPEGEHFDVYAYWANEPAGSTFTAGTVYLGDPNAVEFKNKGKYWGGATTYYWPKNGSLRFSCYSPASVDMTHNLATDTYTVEGYEQPNNTAVTWDLLVAPTSPSYTAQTAAEKVAVEFHHALSWITIQVKAKDAAAAEAYDIRQVTINDVNTKADLNAAMADGISVNEWSNYSVPQEYIVYSGSKTLAADLSAEVIENKTAGTLVIPQATTSVTIDYIQKAMPGTPQLNDQSLTLPLTLTDGTPWEPGKHYVYTLIFTVDEILINPSVQDWEEVIVDDIETPKAAQSVSTEAQLHAALANGVDVVLAADITLEKPAVVNNVNVCINLNGKSLVAPSNDAIVVEAGATLEIVGNGNVKAATDENSSANAIWVKYGNVTLNGGNYYVGKDGATRNDCIYVGAATQKDNAANYVSKVVINGGTYEAAAQEYGQYWVLNIQDQHYAAGSTITVNGGQFKNFDPSNNLSEGANTDFVATGYKSVQNGEWYTVVKE